jgi:peptidoglycan/LPS O-acetylase OafA/YrhL
VAEGPCVSLRKTNKVEKLRALPLFSHLRELQPGRTLSSQRGDNSGHFAYIDALRGFAILAVIAVHTSQATPAYGPFRVYAEQGPRGVQLFYLLSALTLFLSFRARSNKEQRPIGNFFIRRFFRIAPLFYLAIIAYAVREGGASQYWDPDGISPSDLVLQFLFLHGWSPRTINSVVPGGWSIAVEVGAYALMPFAFRFLSSRRRAIVATVFSYAIGVVTSWLALSWLMPRYPAAQQYLVESFVFFWLPAQLVIFGCGIVLFYFLQPPAHADQLSQKRKGRLILSLAVLSLALLPWLPESYPIFTLAPAYAIAFGALTLGLSLESPGLLVNRVTCHIGRVSYSLYLSHVAVIGVVSRLFPQLDKVLPAHFVYPFAYLMVVGAATAFATVTYRLVEVPGQNLGRRIIRRLERLGPQLPVQDQILDPGL